MSGNSCCDGAARSDAFQQKSGGLWFLVCSCCCLPAVHPPLRSPRKCISTMLFVCLRIRQTSRHQSSPGLAVLCKKSIFFPNCSVVTDSSAFKSKVCITHIIPTPLRSPLITDWLQKPPPATIISCSRTALQAQTSNFNMNRALASVYNQAPNKGKTSIYILYKRLFTTCLTTVHSSVTVEALVYLSGKKY